MRKLFKLGVSSTWYMYGCVYNFLSVCLCLTKLSASATLHDTELGVAACQLLLSYRDTQSYNNRSRAQRD